MRARIAFETVTQHHAGHSHVSRSCVRIRAGRPEGTADEAQEGSRRPPRGNHRDIEDPSDARTARRPRPHEERGRKDTGHDGHAPERGIGPHGAAARPADTPRRVVQAHQRQVRGEIDVRQA